MPAMIGSYSPAVLRLKLSFPSSYPSKPPLVTFATDIFHPLLTPLTTYTYTTGSLDTDTVSATDDERLPPGGFSLRHGFPQWFTTFAGDEISLDQTPCALDILRYIKSTFDDSILLDSVPLRAAGNPGAWHAWRAHRSKRLSRCIDEVSKDALDDVKRPESASNAVQQRKAVDNPGKSSRMPGEWDWEGVWEERARKGIDGSIAEPVLFGSLVAGDDLVRMMRDLPRTVRGHTNKLKDSLSQLRS